MENSPQEPLLADCSPLAPLGRTDIALGIAMTTKIAIAGAAGRMGQQILQDAILREAEVAVTGALVEVELEEGLINHLFVHLDKSGATITTNPNAAFAGADVVIDFTLPAATADIMAAAKAAGAAYVLGTTGHSAEQRAAIEAAAQDMPILWAANFSLGVNVLLGLVEKADKALDGFDLDILELHHNQKVDAPSGTALALGRAAAAGRGAQLDQVATYAREGETGARPEGEIGFATLRGGDNPGEHTVMLVGEGERIELSHRALDRSIFAKGAVTAACWLKGQPAGLYGMSDVLGL